MAIPKVDSMIDQDALNEIFPNNPLRQVVFEVRFPFNLRVRRDLCEAQEWLRGAYPRFDFEEMQLAEQLTALFYAFSNEEKTRSIKAAEDRLVVQFMQYECFEIFKEEALSRTTGFCQMFGINEFNRVGLRYVNNIEIPKEGEVYQVTRYVRPYVDIKRACTYGPMHFNLQLTMKTSSCHITSRTAFLMKTPNESNAIYLLDMDTYVQGKRVLKDLDKLLDELHYQAQVEFLSHVTEEYKQVMRGGK